MKLNDALKRIMENKNWTKEELEEKFSSFVEANYPELWVAADKNLNNLDEEDFDFFSSAFEVNNVRRTGGGKGDEWVGMIVAYEGTRDTMQKQRDLAISSALANMGQTLRYGIQINDRQIKIGRVDVDDKEYVVRDGENNLLYRESRVEGKVPQWVIQFESQTANPNSMCICLLKDDGRSPKRAFMPKRKWLFVGNKKEDFFKDGPQTPMQLECSFGAAEVDLQMLRPIHFRAEMEKAWKPQGSDEPDRNILKALDIEPTYGFDWIPDEQMDDKEKMEQFFQPDQYIANFVTSIDLASVFDHHMENRVILSSGRDYGPVFAITGTADYIDYDGKENLYTEGGYKHSLTLTSNSLRREDPKANLWLDVSRYLVNKHHAFRVKKADEWRDYASGSRVWAVVRSRTWQGNDGSLNLNLDALSVYAMPLRSIAVQHAPSDANDISHTDNF